MNKALERQSRAADHEPLTSALRLSQSLAPTNNPNRSAKPDGRSRPFQEESNRLCGLPPRAGVSQRGREHDPDLARGGVHRASNASGLRARTERVRVGLEHSGQLAGGFTIQEADWAPQRRAGGPSISRPTRTASGCAERETSWLITRTRSSPPVRSYSSIQRPGITRRTRSSPSRAAAIRAAISRSCGCRAWGGGAAR